VVVRVVRGVKVLLTVVFGNNSKSYRKVTIGNALTTLTTLTVVFTIS
jgi:hypothetical protein